MSLSVSIGRRFCGPSDSGNGGYLAGLLSVACGGAPVEVTIRRPLPLDRPLAVEEDPSRPGRAVTLTDSGEVLATAHVTAVDVAVPAAPLTLAAARAASAACPVLVHPEWHPAPRCFVCGTERAPGDGLRIFPGSLGDGRYATTWTPAPDLADAAGTVRPEFVWAALDCPSSFVIYSGRDERPEGFFVLGRMAARVDQPVAAGEELVVQAWELGRDGRKLHAASALARPGGELVAVARATWIGI